MNIGIANPERLCSSVVLQESYVLLLPFRRTCRLLTRRDGSLHYLTLFSLGHCRYMILFPLRVQTPPSYVDFEPCPIHSSPPLMHLYLLKARVSPGSTQIICYAGPQKIKLKINKKQGKSREHPNAMFVAGLIILRWTTYLIENVRIAKWFKYVVFIYLFRF